MVQIINKNKLDKMENVLLNISRIETNMDDAINNSIDNCNGTIDSRMDTLQNTSTNKHTTIINNNDDNDYNINIFRFKFTPEFIIELNKFSKVHQYDNRSDFKEAWKTWVEENEELVSYEFRRLTNIGYEGDILDKMFKSARYYFRNKSTEKKEPKKRHNYMSVQREFLEAVDKHIKDNINNEEFKPSGGFDAFCKQHIELLKEEVNQLCKNGFTDSDEIKNKIKKTYKNRYFMLISK
jgi:hypothetical protein